MPGVMVLRPFYFIGGLHVSFNFNNNDSNDIYCIYHYCTNMRSFNFKQKEKLLVT